MVRAKDWQECNLEIGLSFQRNGCAIAVVRKNRREYQLIYLWEDRLVNLRIILEKLQGFLNEASEKAFDLKTTAPERNLHANVFVASTLLAMQLPGIKIIDSRINLILQKFSAIAPTETALTLMLSAINEDRVKAISGIDIRKIIDEINNAPFGENQNYSPTVTALMLSLGECIFRDITEQQAFSFSGSSYRYYGEVVTGISNTVGL